MVYLVLSLEIYNFFYFLDRKSLAITEHYGTINSTILRQSHCTGLYRRLDPENLEEKLFLVLSGVLMLWVG